MTDISLPDDVFENMRHAQETAASMETTVKDFNDKVDKKFKEADANEKNKIKEDNVKAILTAKEKTRYKNIGAVFFEGAKDSIIGIFKQIEKNKSKSLFRKTYDAVADKIKAVKESVEEHKTGLKILGVIALLGGVYYMFKDWFDEKLPKVWDAVKAFPEIISGVFDNTGIKNYLGTFFDNAINELKGFLTRMIDFFKDIFSGGSNDRDAGQEDARNAGIENKSLTIQTKGESHLDTAWDKTGRFIGKVQLLNPLTRDFIKDNIYDPKKLREFTVGGGTLENVFGKSSDTTKKLDTLLKNQEISEKSLKYITSLSKGTTGFKDFSNSSGLSNEMLETLKHRREELQKGIIEDYLTEFYGGDWRHKKDLLGAYAGERSYAEAIQELKDAYPEIFKEIDKQSNKLLGQNLSTLIGESGKTNKKLEEIEQQQQQQNEEMLENTNADKIVDVAVVTSLNQFIKDFFTGDKEGTFKHFSSTTIATIGSELSKINLTVKTELTNISNLVTEKLTSLIKYEKLDKLTDNLIKAQWLLRGLQGTITTEFDTLYDDLTNYSEQKVKNDLKNFITEKFNNTFNGNNTQIFADIIKEEQAQTASLKEQSQILEDTKNVLNQLLYLSGGNTNQVVPVPVQQNNNDIPTSAVPLGSTAADTSTAVYFSSGMSPYSMA